MKTILVDAVNTFVVPDEGVDQGLYDLLETYPNPKIILTNADDEQVIKFGLINLPYQLFSLKHDPDKIDPTYFKKMLERFDLSVDQVVYFEHNQEAVKSALSIGIPSYYFDQKVRDLISLKAFLDSQLQT